MTVPRRERTGRRAWTDGHRTQLATGHDFLGDGWGLLPCLCPDARSFKTLADVPSDVLDEMFACWRDCREQLLADQVDRFPGSRPWFMWVVELLPADSRRKIMPDWPHDESLTPPTATWPWEEHGGHESSMAYLDRRGLWQRGERERVVGMMRQRGLTI